MKEHITILISTRKSKEELQPFIKNIELTINAPYHIMIFNNQGTHSLSYLYSYFLEKENNENKENKEKSIYVFCHDDIEFVTVNWGRKLLDLFNNHQEYGIIGLAGTKVYDGTKPWWNYESKYKVGKVIHRVNGKGMWMTSMSDKPNQDNNDIEEVVAIDGLFIALDADKISQTFDKEIKGFHFYDIDFSLNNFKDKKCKIGVTTNFRVVHQSIGNINDAWVRNQSQVNEKYKDYYPFHVDGIELDLNNDNNNNE